MKRNRYRYIDYNRLLNKNKHHNREKYIKAKKAHKIPRYYVDAMDDETIEKVYDYVNSMLPDIIENQLYTDHLKEKIENKRVYMKPAILKDIEDGNYTIIEVAEFKKENEELEYRFLLKSNSVYKFLKNYTHFDRYEYNNLYLVVSSSKCLVTAYNSNENKKTYVTTERYKNIDKTFKKGVDYSTKVL